MAELVPSSIATESALALEQVVEDRLGALPLERVLVYLLDHVEPSALPALAWQFGALGDSWAQAADDAERRELLRAALLRRRRRGTVWAIRDALSVLGFPDVEIIEDTAILYDGSISYNGLYTYGWHAHWAVFWLQMPYAAAFAQREAIRRTVIEWKRRAAHFAIYFLGEGDTPVARVDQDGTVHLALEPIEVLAGEDVVLAGDDPVVVF